MTTTAVATDCSHDDHTVVPTSRITFAPATIGAALGSLIVVALAVMTTPWLLLLEPLGIVAALWIAAPKALQVSGVERIVMEAWGVRWLAASLGLIGGNGAVLWLAVLGSFAICGHWAGWRLHRAQARMTRRLERPVRTAREPITLSGVVGVSFGEHHVRTRRHERRSRTATIESSADLVDSAA